MTSPQQLTLFAVELHAKTSQLPDVGKAWLEREADSGLTSFDLLVKLNRAGWSGKMSPTHYHLTAGETSEQSSWDWMNAGIMSHGASLTLSIAEFPSDVEESSLSDILETDVPHKYYLSAKACRGILSRARQRGKQLPVSLERCLKAQSGQHHKAQKAICLSANRIGLRRMMRETTNSTKIFPVRFRRKNLVGIR